MDLTKFLGQDTQEQSAQRLSKEEYAAQKKQEREEIWGMIDGKAQEVFQNGDSLKGFLDFMGQPETGERCGIRDHDHNRKKEIPGRT